MITFVDLAKGEVLDVVDGRDSAAVAGWLERQPRWWWRRRVEVVAIDPSGRVPVRRWRSKARVAVDHFHLVKLGKDMPTGVRRRVSWDCHQVQVRTWCGSKPQRPLPAWNDSSIVHRLLATVARDTTVWAWRSFDVLGSLHTRGPAMCRAG